MPTPEPKRETITSTQDTSPWAAQQAPLTYGFGEARKLYDQGPQQFFPGQTFANPSSATMGSLSAIENRATQGNPLLGQAQGEAGKVLSGQYLDPATNPGYQTMIDRTRAAVLPSVTSQYANAGGSGGLKARAAGLGLGDAIGAINYGNYNDERTRMQNAMAAAPGLAQADYYDPQMLGQAGMQREAIAQQPISEAVARHDYGQMSQAENLARYMQMIQGNYGGQQMGTTQQLIPQSNPWMQALGITANVAGTAAKAFMSDRRVKKNIKRVGETDDGLPIYTYEYKFGGAPPMMGVMAQDVVKVKPEAVGLASLMGRGVLTVDYGKL